MFAASLAVPSIRTRIPENDQIIEEQAVPTADEWDEDDVSTHFLAERNDGTPAGCARLVRWTNWTLGGARGRTQAGYRPMLMEAIEFGERQNIGPLLHTLSCMPLSSMNRWFYYHG